LSDKVGFSEMTGRRRKSGLPPTQYHGRPRRKDPSHGDIRWRASHACVLCFRALNAARAAARRRAQGKIPRALRQQLRHAARERGDSVYTGPVCRRCGNSERETKTGLCIFCREIYEASGRRHEMKLQGNRRRYQAAMRAVRAFRHLGLAFERGDDAGA
jgi:hypothetical protein